MTCLINVSSNFYFPIFLRNFGFFSRGLFSKLDASHMNVSWAPLYVHAIEIICLNLFWFYSLVGILRFCLYGDWIWMVYCLFRAWRIQAHILFCSKPQCWQFSNFWILILPKMQPWIAQVKSFFKIAKYTLKFKHQFNFCIQLPMSAINIGKQYIHECNFQNDIKYIILIII